MFIETAEFLVECLYQYCRSDGLLCAVGNCRNGTIISDDLCVDELGDYAQYVSLLGTAVGNAEYSSWALDQTLRGFSVSQGSDGLVYRDKASARQRIRVFPLIRYGDTFWGLAEMYRLHKEERIKEAYENLISSALKFCLVDGIPSYGCIFIGDKAVSFPIAEVMTSGYITESALNMYVLTKEDTYLAIAKHITRRWLETKPFKDHSLFLRHCKRRWQKTLWSLLDLQFRLRRRPGMNETILVKGDTYLIFSLLSLNRISGDDSVRRAIIQWKDAVTKRATSPDGRFFNSINLSTNKKSWLRLEQNHSIIEALLDIAVDLCDEESLEFAERACSSWLSKADHNMLIPNDDEKPFVDLDPLLDFSVNLLKLAELNRKEKFRESAFQILESAIKYFKLPFGFSERIRLDTLKPVSSIVKTKFLGLFIKVLLVFEMVRRGEQIMSKFENRLLASDR